LYGWSSAADCDNQAVAKSAAHGMRLFKAGQLPRCDLFGQEAEAEAAVSAQMLAGHSSALAGQHIAHTGAVLSAAE